MTTTDERRPSAAATPRTAHLRVDAAARDVLPALRLVARGFSPVEIAAQRRCSLADVLRDLDGAQVALRVPTVSGAVAEAKRRGLID